MFFVGSSQLLTLTPKAYNADWKKLHPGGVKNLGSQNWPKVSLNMFMITKLASFHKVVNSIQTLIFSPTINVMSH